jgi:hypothetical protein
MDKNLETKRKNEMYTQNPKTSKAINEQLNKIVQSILKEIKAEGIILGGSFSMGEGAAKIIGKEVYPFNDFDIYVISKKKINGKKADEISEKIAKSIGKLSFNDSNFINQKEINFKDTFVLDLKFLSIKELKTLLPRLRNYSLKYKSRVIYGKDLRKLIPEYKLKDIPLSEAAKLLLDRMGQNVEYYSKVKKNDLEMFSLKFCQSYAACATALLLLSQKFDCSYVKSMEILKETYKKDFPELYRKIPDLHFSVEKYVKWKLNPKKIPFKELDKELTKATQDILEVSKFFFSKFLNKKISNEKELSNELLKMGKKFYMPYIKSKFSVNSSFLCNILFILTGAFFRWNYFLRLRKVSKEYFFRVLFKKYSPDMYIFSSIPYLALYISSGNEQFLHNLKNRLKNVIYTEETTWEELNLNYRKAYISFFLQKIG